MAQKDPRVDAYIAKSADFAKPILSHIRELVHATCPDVEETMKWSFPHFLYKGMMCSMAAFKEHASFGFWKSSLILPGSVEPSEKGMGSFGKLTSISDLPAKKVLIGYIKKAMALNDEGVKSPTRSKPKTVKELVVPEDLMEALNQNSTAKAAFEKFSPSHKREYIEWITEAKTQPTRIKRLQTTIEWLVEGKSRNWKYMNC